MFIHGDPEELRSVAAILIALADTYQNQIASLPEGAMEHFHLRPKYELSNSSEHVILGRLDEKGTSIFYEEYIPR